MRLSVTGHLQITLLTIDQADHAAWRLALQSIGATVWDERVAAARGESPDLCVLVIPPHMRRTRAHTFVGLAGARTLLVCDDAMLAAQLSPRLLHPTLITTTRCARDFLQPQIQLLRDMASGCLWYEGPGLTAATDARSPLLTSARGTQ
jgi:hypothetical protein